MPYSVPREKVRLAHITIESKLAPHFKNLPELIQTEYNKLNPLIAKFVYIQEQISKARDEKSTATKLLDEWADKLDKTVKEINHTLRGKHPELVEVYFKDVKPSAMTTTTKRFKVLNHIIPLTEMETRTELKEYSSRLRLLRDEGEKILSSKTTKTAASTTETKEFNAASDAYLGQLQKVKYYLQGFFYGTDVDCSELFLDLTPSKKGKKPSNPELKPVKPIDKINTGTVIVPPPVISPVEK